jgi:hypothetical protein
MEVWLARISAQITYLRAGERETLLQLQTGKAPGASDLASGWAVGSARDQAKSLHLPATRPAPRLASRHRW